MKNIFLLCLLLVFPFFLSCEKDEEEWVDIPDPDNVKLAELPISQVQELTIGRWYLVQTFNGWHGYSEEYTPENSPEVLILEKNRYAIISSRYPYEIDWTYISWKKFRRHSIFDEYCCIFTKKTNLKCFRIQMRNGRLVLDDDEIDDGGSDYYKRL